MCTCKGLLYFIKFGKNRCEIYTYTCRSTRKTVGLESAADGWTHFVCTEIIWQFRRSITQTEYKIWLMGCFRWTIISHVTTCRMCAERERTFFTGRFSEWERVGQRDWDGQKEKHRRHSLSSAAANNNYFMFSLAQRSPNGTWFFDKTPHLIVIVLGRYMSSSSLCHYYYSYSSAQWMNFGHDSKEMKNNCGNDFASAY